MRTPTFLVAASLSLIAVPAVAQDFLGRLAQNTAEAAARRLANRAVDAATAPRPATPPATRPAAPAAPPARPATSAPTAAATQAAPAEAPASSGASIALRNKMPVITSDGVRVAETIHVDGGEETYAPNQSFFTTDQYYRLRRIYGREATVRGGSVHLKMTAAQYRARGQNPED